MPTRKRSKYILLSITLIFLLYGSASLIFPVKAFKFSFTVMSDPQYRSESWINSLTEARDMKADYDSKFSHSEFLLVTGDITPIDIMYNEYKKVFKGTGNPPVFLPVIGNHEFDDSDGMPGGMPPFLHQPPLTEGGPPGMEGLRGEGGPPGAGRPPGMEGQDGDPSIIDFEFIRDKIIPKITNVVRLKDKSCSYYYDHKNVRIISLDGYSDEIGKWGIINEEGRKWTEEVIKSSPAKIDHIFIAFHAPAFPRGRHTQDSFNADPDLRNAFWNMLIAHGDRVRAVFVGHTHSYSRMRVLDPSGTAANDFSVHPDEEGGLYQINSGSTGSGMKNTFIMVKIEGKDVYFRAYEAENGMNQPFSVKDEWHIPAILQAK
jgi:hypothetical protein